MTEKTPKEQLEGQLKRLSLDDDLKLMVFEGLKTLPDEDAIKLTEELKKALDVIPEVVRVIIKERKTN